MRTMIGVGVATMVVMVTGALLADERPDRPPNIVFIFTDDQGYGDLGCFGGDHLRTPNIDAMAAEGVKLTSHYAAPVCTPSRAMLMTGSYALRVGLARGSRHSVLLSADAHGLNPDEITIADALKARGYATACFGKWHLGDQPEFLPTRQGFDEFYGLPYSHDIHPGNNARHKFAPLPMLEGERVVAVDPDADQFTKVFTDKTIDFMKRHRDKPFFVYLPHPMPHRPLHVTEEFLDPSTDPLPSPWPNTRSRDFLLTEALEEIDHNVGRILEAIKELGLDENTIVIFTTDNGPAIGSAGPLRGRKGSVWEGGVRVPGVVRWPGKIPADTTVAGITTLMDWLPTLVKLAGGEPPQDRVIDGHDIWPLLSGASAESPYDMVLLGGGRMRAVRSGPWKLMDDNQLFNLDDDIGEKRNVAGRHPDIVADLRQRRDEWHCRVSKV